MMLYQTAADLVFEETGRDLHISPSTEQNIIKAFKESGGVSV